MANLAFDFSSKNCEEQHPKHGWAFNTQGVKLLWLPLLRALNQSQEIRWKYGLKEELRPSEVHEIKCFCQDICKLILALRELHRLEIYITGLEGIKYLVRDTEGELENISLYVDLVYVYLRRLADRFSRVIRYPAFEHYNSASREFKSLRKFNKDMLLKAKPFVDIDALRVAITSNDSWFDQLSAPGEDKGLRDVMEHRPTVISVGSSKVGDAPWKTEAFLLYGNKRVELLARIPRIVAEICAMFSEVHKAIFGGGAYTQKIFPHGDCFVVAGNDANWTGYWPAIGSEEKE